EFEEALNAYRAGDWEKVGLKSGKFCEVAYNVCMGHATGSFPELPRKPPNFAKCCQQLEQYNRSKGRSLCVQVPKVLTAIYELRNNRAIGHVSPEVRPNQMDAELFMRALKWIMGEMVRNFSQLPLADAHAVVEAVTARTFPIIWSEGDARRVLAPATSAAQRVLLILYHEGKSVGIAKLQRWVEYKNTTDFKKKFLGSPHRKALIHINEATATVSLLPTGQAEVEKSGLLMSMS
ncbi:MAG: hypothetical protein SNJ63_05765, partial [Sphingomonadaceae bacterium]